jgi:methyl-accepting chemotaxis protein
MKIKMNLTTKLFVSIIGVVFILNTVMIVVSAIGTSMQSKSIGRELVISKSNEISLEVENYLNQAIETGKTMSNTFLAMKENNSSREEVEQVIKKILQANNGYEAVWIMWEPNAFDGNDINHLNDKAYEQSNGAFNLSYYKNGAEIVIEPGTTSQYSEDYYKIPKSNHEISVIDPYDYSYTGNDKDMVYETTISVPIMENGIFYGVIGIDITLDKLMKIIEASHLYKTGFASIISNELQVSAHPDSKYLKKNVSEFIKDSETIDKIKLGKAFEIQERSIINGKKVIRYFTPIHFNGFSKSWTTMTEVPLKEVFEKVYDIIRLMILNGLGSLILLGIIVFFISRNISSPIIRGSKLAKRIAAGDLTSRIEVEKREDEIGELSRALETMSLKLVEVVAGIKDGANAITSASIQMSTTAEEFSQGASEHASTIEEVSSTMEEVASMIEINAKNAQETEHISVSAQQSIRDVMQGAVEAMEASKVISNKIGIINEIAFQTNILALNAAVEAARAGEHGLGFAVIADEVRRLADNSKVAAAEIVKLSSNSLKLSEISSRKMIQLLPEIEKTTNLVLEISQSSLQQSQGIMQVNTSVYEMNNVAQINASASELMAGSAEELASQAEVLNELVSFFKIKSDNDTSRQ